MEQIPVNVSAGEQDLVEHIRAGEVGAQHTEGDGQKQQGLKALADGEIQQHKGDGDHDEHLPVVANAKLSKAGLLGKV